MVSLAPNEAAPQLVGEGITWTATATNCGATPIYQFSVAPHAGAFRVVRDFSPTNAFTWTPMQEGAYDIEVTVKDGYLATETTSAVAVDAVASRVTGSQPVITPTLNPLVALYRATRGLSVGVMTACDPDTREATASATTAVVVSVA